MNFKSIILFIPLIISSCSEKNIPTIDAFKNAFNKIQLAQKYENFIEINSVISVIQVNNMSNQQDTLFLYTAVTRFHQDKNKPKQYLRLCFLSNPYEFYQTPKENGKHTYTIGEINSSSKTIQILKNGEYFISVSKLHQTTVE